MCSGCGQPICVQCGGMVDGQLTCPDCRQRQDAAYSVVAPSTLAARWPFRALAVAGIAALGVVIAVVALLFAGLVAHSGSANALADSTGAGSPADLVQRHYAVLASGDYQTAWQQLSPSFQSQVQYAAWANPYAGSRIEPSKLDVSSQSGTSATVVGDVTITSDQAAPTIGRGQWTLSLVDSGWRIDTASFMSAMSEER